MPAAAPEPGPDRTSAAPPSSDVPTHITAKATDTTSATTVAARPGRADRSRAVVPAGMRSWPTPQDANEQDHADRAWGAGSPGPLTGPHRRPTVRRVDERTPDAQTANTSNAGGRPDGTRPTGTPPTGTSPSGTPDGAAAGQRAALVLVVRPWWEPGLAMAGHDPLGPYVESHWLPVLGPSAVCALRWMTRRLRDAPEGFQVPHGDFARSLGLGRRGGTHSPSVRCLERLGYFQLVRPLAAPVGFGYEVRTHVPDLPPHLLRRLPRRAGA